ncbi:MAG: hypothetical protein IKU36_04880 [Bacteroidales bacterium]|nr:hypothetical protein [Bacteroidales bacterium]
MIRLRTGHNAIFGRFAAFSLETLQDFDNNLYLSGGVQYNTIGKIAVEARPAYYIDRSWGRITAETLFAYRDLASVNSFAAGAGAEYSGRWLAAKLGYYYHLYGHKGESVKEPFNVYYELRVNLLPNSELWALQLAITNCEIFELERHYQPSFIAQCSYDLKDCLGLSMGVGLKPAGMFNLSAEYYQSFINLGICYRW